MNWIFVILGAIGSFLITFFFSNQTIKRKDKALEVVRSQRDNYKVQSTVNEISAKVDKKLTVEKAKITDDNSKLIFNLEKEYKIKQEDKPIEGTIAVDNELLTTAIAWNDYHDDSVAPMTKEMKDENQNILDIVNSAVSSSNEFGELQDSRSSDSTNTDATT